MVPRRKTLGNAALMRRQVNCHKMEPHTTYIQATCCLKCSSSHLLSPPPKNLTSSPTAYIPYIQINTHIHNKRCTQTLASIFLYKALLENKRARCTLTIFFFWQRNAWHSKVSLNWLWETYAKTLSWVLSAVQYEILEEKKKKKKKNQQTSY